MDGHAAVEKCFLHRSREAATDFISQRREAGAGIARAAISIPGHAGFSKYGSARTPPGAAGFAVGQFKFAIWAPVSMVGRGGRDRNSRQLLDDCRSALETVAVANRRVGIRRHGEEGVL